MSITYVNNIPVSTNNPSTDQPNMTLNTNSLSQIWTVDHNGFNTNNSGTHLQVTIPAYTTPSNPTGTASVVYTKAGSANNTAANLIYANSAATRTAGGLILSAVRAFGSFLTGSGALSFINQYNCASVSQSGTTITVTINSNIISGNNVVAIVSSGQTGGAPGYSYTANVLTINMATSSFWIVTGKQ